MSFDLAVWYCETAPSEEEALATYIGLCEGTWIPTDAHDSVAAFYDELCRRYPEIDSLPESELENCPWSCAHDRSGLHVIICMRHGAKSMEAATLIADLAAKHGLICFDPQGPNLYLPPNLMLPKKRSWLSHLVSRIAG